jgi:recombination protein RecA
VFISQVREKIGVMFGNPEVSTGGRALKFFSSMRMRVNVVTKPDAKSGPTAEEGNHIKVKVIKNKCAKPHLEAEFFLNYEKGIDNDREILFAGVEKGIITLDGRTYTFEKWEAVGKEKMIKLIQDTPELKTSLLEKVKHSIASSSPVAAVDEEVTLEDIEEAASISNKTIEQEMEEEEAADKKKMRVTRGPTS